MANNEKIDELISPKALEQFDKLLASLDIGSDKMASLVTEADKFNKAISGSKSLSEFAENTKKANIEIEKTQKQLEKTRLDEIRLQQAREKAFDKYDKQLAKENAAQQKTAQRVAESSRAYNVLSQRLDEARKKAKDLGVTFGTSSTQFKAAQKEVLALDTQIKKIDSSLGNNQRNVGNYSSALTGLGNNIKGLVLGYISFQAAINSLNATFTTSVQLDAVKTSLGFIFRETGDVNERLRMLSYTAERLGLEFLPLANSYKSFAGAAVASKFPLEEADRLFQSVANASAKLKLSSEQTEGALNALQQMISKGNVQAEELRGQLGERIPGAFSIAARAMGVTEQQLNKLLKDGDVLASELLPKLATELDKTFDNNLDEKVDSLQSSVNRLKNVFTNAVNEGNVTSFFKQIVDGAFYVADTLAKVVTSTGWNEFFSRLSSNKEADVIRGINIAFRDGKKEIEEVGKSAQATQAQYNAITIALTNAKKQYDIYNSAVEKGELKQGGNATLNEYISLIKSLEFQQSRLANVLPKVTNEQNKNTEVTKKTKEEIAKEIRALLDRNKAKRDAILADLEFQKLVSEGSSKVAKKLSDDENLNTEDRIANLERYIQERQNILNIEKQIADTKTDYEVNALKIEGKLTKEERDKINNERKVSAEKFRQENIELDSVANKEALDIFIDQLDERQKAEIEANKKSLNDLAIRRDEALALVAGEGKTLAKQKEDAAEQEFEIQLYYNRLIIEEEIKQTERLIEQAKLRGENVSDQEARIAALKLKLSKETTDAQIKDADKLEERQKRFNDFVKESAFEVADIVSSLVNSAAQSRLDALDKEAEKIQSNYDFEKEQIEESLISEEEKNVKLAQLDADRAAQEEQIEQRKREIQVSQARFAKAMAIAEIAYNTGAAIMGIWAQVPKFDFGISAGILTGVVSALGAAQIATVLATPVPGYYTGVESSPEGLAYVGERGTEGRINPDGSFELTPNKTTLTYLEKGTQIIPHNELNMMLANANIDPVSPSMTMDFYRLEEAINKGSKQTIKAIKNNKSTGTVITKSGWRQTQKKNAGWTKYIGRNIN